MTRSLLLLLAACAGGGPDDGDPTLLAGADACEDATDAAEATGTMEVSIAGTPYTGWRLQVVAYPDDAETSFVETYGCVLDGDAQIAEWSMLFNLPNVVAEALVLAPETVVAPRGFNGGVNHTRQGDLDDFLIQPGASGSATITAFDVAARTLTGSVDATADGAVAAEAGETARVVATFDLAW